MRDFLKKVLAIVLALGFCFTSIPAGQIAAEPLEMTEVPVEQTIPTEIINEDTAVEPEAVPVDLPAATDDGSGYDTATYPQGAVDDGSGYDAATGEYYDTSAPIEDTSSDVTEAYQAPSVEPDVYTETPEYVSPSEAQSMTEIIPAAEISPTEAPNEEVTTTQEVTTPEETTPATKTSFIYEDPEIYVEATLDEEDALPENAVFVVKQIFEDSLLDTDRGLFQWSNELLDKYLEKIDLAQVNTFVYDMYFELDGERLMPSKEFKIKLTYKKDKVLDEEAKKENVRIFHLDDNDYTREVEAFDTNAELWVNEKGSVTTAEFKIPRYRYTPLMISMLETKEEHEARLAEEASKEAEENAAAEDEKNLIVMDDPDQEPESDAEETDQEMITTEDEEGSEKAEEETEEEETTPERRYYTSWGNDVDITVILSDPAQVPDTAEVVVTPVTPEAEDYNYDAYIEALNSSDESIDYTPDNTLLYDIKFVDTIRDENGEIVEEIEYEPTEGSVKVILKFNNNQLSNEINAKKNQNVTVNHLVTDAETDITDISAGDISVFGVDAAVQLEGTDTVTFSTESFSVYAFSYTVDFEYSVNGKTYQFSMHGGETIALSDLIEVLGIVGDADNDEKAAFDSADAFLKEVANVEFSDESLVKVTPVEGDWELESLQPFDTEESLTITMENGDVITVKVTDARRPALSNTYGRIKIVKEWYDKDGNRIEAPTLDDTYTSDFILTAYEYAPSDLVRLHFVGTDGNDVNAPVIVPTGSLQLTLYNTPAGDGKGYVFSEKPINVDNPYNNINLLTDVAIQSKTATLDSGKTINTWVMNIDLNDYAGELYDVYLGIQPSGETTGFSYFNSTSAPTWGAGVSTGTHAMNIAFLDSGRWQGDTYRNRHIWDMIKGTNNEYTLQNQDLELTSEGGKFFAYTIVENEASANGAKNFTTTISWNNGADTIYSNGLTGWSPNLYLNMPVLSNTDATVVTVKNQLRADVDVPVEKHWPYMDEFDNQYDWEATFVLQYAPLYEGEGTPSTEFKEVEPRQYITITEAMMDDFSNTFSARSFKKLPMYGQDENGPFRYEYSVEEESYKIYEHGNPANVLATYDRNAPEGEQYTGGLPHFVPFYPHDAGELSANPSDYMVMVTNGQAYSEENPTINITVNKVWEDESVMEDDTHDYHATVKVQRYDQQSTRKVQDYVPGEMVEIKYFDQNNNYIKSDFVEKGVQQRMHITWNSYGHNSSKFAFTSSPNIVSFSDTSHSCGYGMVIDSYSDWFYPTQNIEIHITQNIWNENDQYNKAIAVNPKAGLELLDEQSSSAAGPDTAYNNNPGNTFTLSLLDNRWSTIITGLPLTETTINGDTQTIHHYEYYFEEDLANTTPAGYKSSYIRYDTVGTDNEIEIGSSKYRINYDGEHVTIKNIKDTLRINKEWRGVAKSDWPLYPDTVFDLYGADRNTPINQATDGTLIKSGLHLNKTNNWEWTPEDEDWGADGFPHFDYYYVVERTDLMRANEELGTPAWSNQYEIWMYYNENGTGNNAHPWEAKTSGTGTITIMNALHDSEYLQIDLKKKWMEWGTPTSWDTTTGVYKRLHDLVMGFVVYRRVWDVPIQTNSQYSNNNGHIISPGPMGWSDYGNEILVGYDSNGQRVLDDGGNTFELINGDGGNWHWTIKNRADHNNTTSDQVGLISEGWYTKEDGSVVWAYYEYTVRETGIWKNLKKDPVDDPEISWFSNSVPMASWYKGSSQHRVDEFNRDIGQDQDRLMNGQAFDMYVEKQWDDSAWDAREVYVKIYRQALNGSYKDDFTAELARDIMSGSLIGYLNGNESMIDLNNKWIVFTPGHSGLYIDKVLKAFPNTSGDNPYVYWLVEVGYKDKHGNVHMINTGNDVFNQNAVTDNDLLKLSPTYYTWQDGHYVSGNKPGQNNPNVGIVLGDKGTNKLMVKNTPVRDFAVVKKWQNALGNDISNDPSVPNNLNIKIKQIRTATIEGNKQTYEGYVSFGGSQALTLTKPNSDNKVVVVAQTHPGNSAGAQSYSATVSNDTNVGAWGLYISGLEEKYYDEAGNLWTCTYKVEEQTDGIPDTFVTEVSYDGIIDRDNRNITITNVKMEGGMLKVIKQIAEGSDNETEDPFTITVTLTPPHRGSENSNSYHDVFDYGNGQNTHSVIDYIEVDEEDTILIGEPVVNIADHTNIVTITMTLAGRGSFTIRGIKEGTVYEVKETSAQGWKQVGEVVYSNTNKTIFRKQLDTATITNEQSEEETGNLEITKTVATGGDTTKAFTFNIVFSGDGASAMAGQTYTADLNGVSTNVSVDNDLKATVSLKHGETITIEGLPIGVTYTVTEVADDGYTATYSSTTGSASTSGATGNISATISDVTVTNTPVEEEHGKLTITKQVQYNGARDTQAGTDANPMSFQVGLFTKDGDQYTQVGQTQTISVVAGQTTVPAVFEQLDIGTTYYVFEMNGNDRVGTSFGTYTVTNSGASFTPQSEQKEGTVEIINNMKTTSVNVDKKWFIGEDDVTSAVQNGSVTVKLKAGDQDVTTDAKGNTIAPVTLDGETDDKETTAWAYTWTDLPEKDASGNQIEYQVVETSAKIGDKELLTSDVTAAKDNNGYHLRNVLPNTQIQITKQWKTADNKDKQVEENTSIKADVIKQVNNTPTIIDEAIVKYQHNGEYAYTNAEGLGSWTNDTSAEKWGTTTIRNLPLYEVVNNQLVEVTYSVTEKDMDQVIIQYQVNDQTAADNCAPVSKGTITIINTDVQTDLTVLKVNGDESVPLAGAYFTLTEVDKDGKPKEGGRKNENFGPTDDKGKLQFTGLVPGYYMISEAQAPDGFIPTDETIIIQVVIEENQLVTRRSGEGKLTDISYDPAEKTITVQNHPGSPLPFTGGSGTTLFTILGALLIAGAGAAFLIRSQRRRKKNQN